MTEQWIGPFYDEDYEVGERAFLIRKANLNGGGDRFELRDTPPKTNLSFEWRLDGWCGSYNNISTYGEGMVEVIKLASNGRLKVRNLTGDALRSALDDFGFPELLSE
jgi:hypothetical protein